MKINFNIGEKIRKFREINKFKAEEVIELLSKYGKPITSKTLYKWERNLITPDLDTLSILCHIYNTSLQELFASPDAKYISIGTYEERFLNMIRGNKNYKKALTLIIKNDLAKEDD